MAGLRHGRHRGSALIAAPQRCTPTTPAWRWRRESPIVRCGESAVDMKGAPKRSRRGFRLARGEGFDDATARCIPRLVRENVFAMRPAAERAVILLLRMAGKPFVTEARPSCCRSPAEPIRPRLRRSFYQHRWCRPRGIRAGSRRAPRRWLEVPTAVAITSTDTFECIHAGFDTAHANASPDRVPPVDVAARSRRKVGSEASPTTHS